MSRLTKTLAITLSAAALASLVLLAGCSGSTTSSANNSTAGNTAATSNNSSTASSASVTIGTLATEDILPMWVAESEGLWPEGITANVAVFQSATELIAAISAGEVDFAMTDPMVTASIYASGTDVQIKWVTLGTTAAQGRFGIMTSDSSITSLADLAGVPIGVGSNTILEYVMDTLLERAGVPADQVVTEELQKLPVRYQAMASGQVKAAALPASLLALGEANGCTVIADDTTGDNISQSVMIARTAYLLENPQVEAALETAWNAAVDKINASPESYRSLLVEKANLSEAIASTYPISEYPTCQLPTQKQVDDVLAWMRGKGYLSADLTYDAATGTFSKK